MIVLKEELMHQCRNVGPRAFIGNAEISGEGYVMSSELGTFKLVNRQVFSAANFRNGKYVIAWHIVLVRDTAVPPFMGGRL